MPISIKVDLALVQAKLPLRGLADVMLEWNGEELTIRRCAVFAKPGEPPWATLPRLPIEKQGKRIYVPLIDLHRNLKQRVLDAVLREYTRQRDDVTTSSPGVSGPNVRATSGLTTRDSVRQETPGGPLPGLEVKAAEKLGTGKGRRRRPT
jgi:hypothetical protein